MASAILTARKASRQDLGPMLPKDMMRWGHVGRGVEASIVPGELGGGGVGWERDISDVQC